MGANIHRRLLLVIPTMIGIMFVNFTLTQFGPGGQIEQIDAWLEGDRCKLGSSSGAWSSSDLPARAFDAPSQLKGKQWNS